MTIANTILIICFTSIFWLLILLNELRVHKYHIKELVKMHNMICEDYENHINTLDEMLWEFYDNTEFEIIESEDK